MNDRMVGATAEPIRRLPLSVKLFSPILKALLAARVPLGPNRLITIRGRTTGQPRTAALAVIAVAGRRWVWAPWGNVQWVQNLRAAGRATIKDRRGTDDVRATELDPTERVAFFRDIYAPLVQSIPFGEWFVRLVDGVDVRDPVDAAAGRVVFELHPL